jgi:hypothetical protein
LLGPRSGRLAEQTLVTHAREARGPRPGEQFLLGFRGLALPDWLRAFEAEHGLGGVILFDRDVQLGGLRNVESPAQLRALCVEVHALPSRPLVFVDQEGGRVLRLKPAPASRSCRARAPSRRCPRRKPGGSRPRAAPR